METVVANITPGLTQPSLVQSEVLMTMSYPSAGVQRRDYPSECSLQARSPGTRKPYCLGTYHISHQVPYST